MKLLETIKLLGGEFCNLEYHQSRMTKSGQQLFGHHFDINLKNELNNISKPYYQGLQKCRVIYNKDITHIEFHPYTLPVINSLKIVKCDDINYPNKFLDRSSLETLFSLRDRCDDIIILKDGLVTDSYFANLIFYDGYGWYTPSRPLLKGTKRSQLIDKGIITVADISIDILHGYQKVRLINALIDFEDEIDVLISEIKF